ncbi:ribonuclease H-like protein [Armillaria gallica]|uniref:ribonuclease H n=1 Tax=Armillaria gallica TaxID=47427 RepID=A0A2H3DA98_ARMGA|nr:ribonuclease H-like protein [Armillaria gallica]PBK85997.1 ribonuclease H-like protein [Armillaria gallica]
MLIDTIKYRPSTEEALTKLYGLVFFSSSSPVVAYTDGACFHNGTPHARAGAGVYFGPNSLLNGSFRVTGSQTNNRGELLAVLQCLVVACPDRTLHILTDSDNGDLLADIAAWIHYRTAPLVLEHVDAHSGNAHNDAADALAKVGANTLIPA